MSVTSRDCIRRQHSAGRRDREGIDRFSQIIKSAGIKAE
jgi:hypothetical protein